WEGFKREFSSSGVLTVPTLAERQGAFAVTVRDPQTGLPFANNTIPQSRWDPLAAKILNEYSKPNRDGRIASNGLTADNYAYQAPGRENTHKVDVRSDLVGDSRNRFFVRYSLFRQRIYRDQILDGIAETNGNQGEQYNINHGTGVSWNRIFGPNMVNEL